MGKSKHNDWMVKVGTKHRVFRKSSDKKGSTYDVLEFSRYAYTPMVMDKVSKAIRENLTPELFHGTEILEDYPPDHERWKFPYFGYCVPATFALLYLMDTNTLEPMRGEDASGEGHWWLRDILTREIYDLTLDQFPTYEELENVYATGKPSGHYGGRKPYYQNPDARFLDLMQKVQPDAIRWHTDYPDEERSDLQAFIDE
jgi:hypothetical protein